MAINTDQFGYDAYTQDQENFGQASPDSGFQIGADNFGYGSEITPSDPFSVGNSIGGLSPADDPSRWDAMGENQQNAVMGSILGGTAAVGSTISELGSSRKDKRAIADIRAMEEEQDRLNEEEMGRQKTLSEELVAKNESLIKEQTTFLSRHNDLKKLMEEQFGRYKTQETAREKIADTNFNNEMLRKMKLVKEGWSTWSCCGSSNGIPSSGNHSCRTIVYYRDVQWRSRKSR